MLRDVLLLLYPGAQPIDVSGPLQALTTANEECGDQAYRIRFAALTPGPVLLHGGLPVIASSLPRRMPDTLLVPGGPGVHDARGAPGLLPALRRLAEGARRTCSICTGAFLLAEAGLLDGRRAATHWRSCARLAAEFPAVEVTPDPIWVRDGSVWTSAGVTAGIDLALALIDEDLGPRVAAEVARRLVVYMRRPGGQAQYSAPLSLQVDKTFAPLIAWAAENLHLPLSTEMLAERTTMAPRSFHRHFLATTGATPAKAIEQLRLDRARALMETPHTSVAEIARRTGFGSEERMRRAFVRSFGVGPSEWRSRFGALDSLRPA